MQLPALAVQTGDVTNGLLKAQQLAASQQGIESSQIRNKLLMQQQQDQQAARAQQGQINQLASGAVGGDESALKRLMAVDPERAQQIVGLQGKLNEQQRAAAKAKAEFFGRGARILANTPQGKRPGVYANLRAGLIQRGVAGENELPPEYSADIDQNLQMLGLESDALNEMLDETRYETIRNDAGQVVGQRNLKTGKMESDPRAPKEVAPTEISKLIAEYNAMDEVDPNREIIKQRLMKLVQPTGTSLTVDADGNISFSQGGVSAPLGKKAVNDVEEGILNAGAAMQRIMNIERSFNPEFLTLGRQFENWTSAIQDKTIGGLSPEAKRKMGEYTRFTTATLSNVNRTIKELTGAAMSQGEAKRIMGELPNEKDSPTEFKAKMDLVTENLRNVMARLNYIRNNGISIEDVRIDEMRGIIAQRGEELLKELRQPGLSEDDLENMVLGRLANEFGLVGG